MNISSSIMERSGNALYIRNMDGYTTGSNKLDVEEKEWSNFLVRLLDDS